MTLHCDISWDSRRVWKIILKVQSFARMLVVVVDYSKRIQMKIWPGKRWMRQRQGELKVQSFQFSFPNDIVESTNISEQWSVTIFTVYYHPGNSTEPWCPEIFLGAPSHRHVDHLHGWLLVSSPSRNLADMVWLKTFSINHNVRLSGVAQNLQVNKGTLIWWDIPKHYRCPLAKKKKCKRKRKKGEKKNKRWRLRLWRQRPDVFGQGQSPVAQSPS